MMVQSRSTVAVLCSAFFFNDTATTEIYTLSLHDALPISLENLAGAPEQEYFADGLTESLIDRKSTRLNSSHRCISYAVFCLKKTGQARDRPPVRAGGGRARLRGLQLPAGRRRRDQSGGGLPDGLLGPLFFKFRAAPRPGPPSPPALPPG